jgi:hypothetical protein
MEDRTRKKKKNGLSCVCSNGEKVKDEEKKEILMRRVICPFSIY